MPKHIWVENAACNGEVWCPACHRVREEVADPDENCPNTFRPWSVDPNRQEADRGRD